MARHTGLSSNIKADHIDASTSKGLHRKSRGGGHDAGDLLRCRQIGVDDHVQADLLLQHIGVPAILRAAHPGDGMARPQLFCYEAAQQIRIVQVGHGDDQICRLRAGLLQHTNGCAVALDAHDIQGILRTVQRNGVVVHHDDVMAFAGELAGDGIAHFPVSHNDDLHSVSSSSFARRIVFLSLCARRAPLYSAPMISTWPLIYSHSSTTTMVAMEPYSSV